MIEPSRAVFLSYASEDAEAAERIATALRGAEIEVWFDRNALRGGDAWDRQIRDQIRDCRLFIAVISAHTEARDEGYFRREWKVAVDRTGDMHERKSFLVPVVVDGTSERGAAVPEKFRELQWTRLPGGETAPAFVDRVRTLLSPGTSRAAAASSASSQLLGTLPNEPQLKTRSLLPWILAVAAIFLVVAYVVIDKAGSKKTAAASPSAAANTVSKPELGSGGALDKSVAVLPLKNESGDPKQEYFSDGLSEDLITALSHIPELKVIGRTSSFQFRDTKLGSKAIADQLGVARLIEGSVRSDGKTIRVSAELINAADGRTLWSERYDRPFKNLFDLQDEITQALAQALKTHLLPSATISIESDRPPSGNLEAYTAYQQGHYLRYYKNKRELRQAIAFLTRATQLDPKYLQAWSDLTIVWHYLGSFWLDGAELQQADANARGAAEKARRLAPDAVATHLAWGLLYQDVDFDQLAAETEYRRAVELEPQSGDARYFLADEWATLGRLNDAVTLMQEVLALDPLQADRYSRLGRYLLGLNRIQNAEQAARQAIALQSEEASYHAILAQILIKKGDVQAALEEARQEVSGVWQDVALAQALAIGSDRPAADAALKALVNTWASEWAYQIAEVYALRRDPEAMFQWLDRAWAQRDAGISFLHYDPFVLRYKDDPRMAAFCKKVGLPTPTEVAAQNKIKPT